MRARPRAIAAALLLLASCNQPSTDRSGEGNDTAPAARASAPSPIPSPAADLSRFEGKYPFDKVDGGGFLHQPAVTAAIGRSGAPDEVRRFILAADGPQTPIARQGLSLVAWGCEAHNCDAHNWSVRIGSDGTGGEVCYLDQDSSKPPHWYADGRPEAKQESCG